MMQQCEKMKTKLPSGVLQELAERLDVRASRGLLAKAIDEPLHQRHLSMNKDVVLLTNCSLRSLGMR